MSDWKTRAVKADSGWKSRAVVAEPEIQSVTESNKGRGMLESVGRQIESYTAAPSRAAIQSLLDKGNILGAFVKQMGKDPDAAPTGRQISANAGIPDDEEPTKFLPENFKQLSSANLFKAPGATIPEVMTSPAAVAGVGVDLAADWTNALPALGPLNKFVKATKAGKYVEKGAKAAGVFAKNTAVKGATKVGEMLTGIPAEEIKTYVSKLEKVNQMIANAGGDTAQMADDAREGFMRDIQGKRKELSGKITKVLDAAPKDKTLDISGVLTKLEDTKKGINATLNPEDIAQVDELAGRIRQLAPDGKVSVKDLFDIKEFLQERAKGAYQKAGQVFMPGKESQRAAKTGAAEARKLLNEAAPEIKEANNSLSILHELEARTNKNLITAGKPESALFAAGGTSSSRNRKTLEKFGKAVGKDFVGTADELAAARRFSNPKLTPVDTTGKSLLRTGIGSALGWAAGGPIGGAIGAAMTSPAALKAAINAGDFSLDVFKAFAGKGAKVNDATIGLVWKQLQTAKGQALLKTLRTEIPPREVAIAEKEKNGGSNAMSRRLSDKIR